ncbi:hypothetical protein OG607_21145 [Streptomyces sp. NBC_01537]|uniref:hypothetical protein n=1 Tax=Streptomyces sp. NBC_01537 TaxID=2903896 RepID=UPI003863BD70
MTEELDDGRKPRWIRTCFVSLPDGDVVAAFEIDGRRYADEGQARQVYEEALAEMGRRWADWEWETRMASPTEPPSRLPSWEQYRVDLDAKHPVPGVG